MLRIPVTYEVEQGFWRKPFDYVGKTINTAQDLEIRHEAFDASTDQDKITGLLKCSPINQKILSEATNPILDSELVHYDDNKTYHMTYCYLIDIEHSTEAISSLKADFGINMIASMLTLRKQPVFGDAFLFSIDCGGKIVPTDRADLVRVLESKQSHGAILVKGDVKKQITITNNLEEMATKFLGSGKVEMKLIGISGIDFMQMSVCEKEGCIFAVFLDAEHNGLGNLKLADYERARQAQAHPERERVSKNAFHPFAGLGN